VNLVRKGAALHGNSDLQDIIEEIGHSVVTAPGHGATFRLMPEDAPPGEVAWGMEGMGAIFGGEEVQQYLLETQTHWQITGKGKLFLNSLLELFLGE